MAIERASKNAQDFGYVFSSALEDAIINGDKLRDVMNALGKDIARMIIRKTITEPLGNAIGSAIANAIPSFQSGTDYVPYTGLALVHKGEKIIPAAENAGTSINFTVNSLDPSTAAQVLVANRRVIEGVIRRAYHRAGREPGMAP
jgi:hypothetical protein